MKSPTIEITLELDLDGETVSGRATNRSGPTREFSGWIGLMGVVDALLDEGRGIAAPTNRSEKETHDREGEARC
ncbi:MAG: hypothetical protein GEU88_12140 [Solirubrobacterales bacterium]|nr:hypothetical protein [Solirubrobacterales bacterium]